MENEIEIKSILVKEQIEKDLKEVNEQELERIFDEFQTDKRNNSFIKYYNDTILDKAKIKFSTFSYQWALHLTKSFISFFDEKFDSLINEIKNKKDIKEFHDNFCIDNLGKRRGSFCSKLFHTILPSEFPPVDNPIRKKFKLQREDFITSVLIIKRGYEIFIKENPEIISLIKKAILSKTKFDFLRVNELSDIRILDMYYWIKESRNKNKIV